MALVSVTASQIDFTQNSQDILFKDQLDGSIVVKKEEGCMDTIEFELQEEVENESV